MDCQIMCEVAECNGVQILTIHTSQTCIMAAHASKRAKEDAWRKKEKVKEEKEASKRLKGETEKKMEKEKIVEMLQNAHISRMYFLKGYAPKESGKPHHKSSDNGGSSSKNEDSDLSSTSSEEEKSESDVASSG